MTSYAKIGHNIGQLVARKQQAYGDAHGRAGSVMRILYPDGISHEQMDDALTVTRILDKLFRIATSKKALGESPYSDLAGYGILGVARDSGVETVPAAEVPASEVQALCDVCSVPVYGAAEFFGRCYACDSETQPPPLPRWDLSTERDDDPPSKCRECGDTGRGTTYAFGLCFACSLGRADRD